MQLTRVLFAASLSAGLALAGAAGAQQAAQATESWLPSLITETPEEGFALAVTLSRRGVTTTQTDREVLHALRPSYSHDARSLIAVSQVVATHFATIAAANNYWR